MRGRGRLLGVGGALALVLACGEDKLEAAQVAEHCGVAGPVRVLEHAADETIYYRHQRIGERLFFSVGPSEALVGVLPYNSVGDEQLWTTGLCGESPERLDRRYRRFFVSDRWPDVALVCGDGNVSSLSAGGPLDVHVVFPATGCDATWTQHGLVMPDRSDWLDFLPYPDDPRTETAARIKLPVSVAVRGAGAEPVISAAGDGVLVLQADGELVYVDLRDRSVTGVRTGVGDFLASPSGRYVLWRGVAPGDDDGTIVGPQTLVLEDRGTGTSVALGEGYLSEDSLRWGDQGHLILYETDAVRLYRLPDLASSALPQGYRLARSSAWQPVDPLLDGRWIVSSEKGSSLHYFDPATGALDPLFTGSSGFLVER